MGLDALVQKLRTNREKPLVWGHVGSKDRGAGRRRKVEIYTGGGIESAQEGALPFREYNHYPRRNRCTARICRQRLFGDKSGIPTGGE
ncbi:hypothetical protein D3C81_1616580 [compost metagenome]